MEEMVLDDTEEVKSLEIPNHDHGRIEFQDLDNMEQWILRVVHREGKWSELLGLRPRSI